MMLEKNEKPQNLKTEKELIQLIIFRAGNEEFGVPIDVVREIIKMGQVTPMPTSPDFIKGIINVRGEIVTTIDIKLRFGLTSVSNAEPKHIIVTRQQLGLFGLIVDEVLEVLRIPKSDIKPAPSVVTQKHKKYVSGVVTHENRLIILLDLSEVFSHKDLIHPLQNKKKQKVKESNVEKINVENQESVKTSGRKRNNRKKI